MTENENLYKRLGVKIIESDRKDEAIDECNWWQAEDDDIHKYVYPLARKIYDNQSERRVANSNMARLYGNRIYHSLTGKEHSKTNGRAFTNRKNNLKLNVVKSCVDTVCAKISKNKSEIRFTTDGADYDLQEKAKLATKYMDGLFEASNFYKEAQQAFRDSAIFDIGAVRIFVEDDKINVKRILPDEILIDEKDGFYNDPSEIHLYRFVNYFRLIELYPKYKVQIKSSMESGGDVMVMESWKKRHKHCITVQNCTLFVEDYEKDFFPIIEMKYDPDLVGSRGMSLAQELAPIQLEINKLLFQISRGLEGAVPRVFFEAESQINKLQYTDEIWSGFTYSHNPPVFMPTSAFTGETYSFLWQLVQQAYQITGVSQLSASSQIPKGLESGAAIREYQDVETQRFSLQALNWEDFLTRSAKVMLDMSRDLAKSNPKFSIKLIDGANQMQNIQWLKDLNLEEDQYILKAFPVSSLPQTPAGRLSWILEMMGKGLITEKATALKLLNVPDLEKFVSLETAGIDIINLTISLILKDGIYEPPNKYIPLEQASLLAHQALLVAQKQNRPSDRLDLLRMWIDECDQLLDQIKSEQVQQQPPPVQMQAPPQAA